MPLTNDEVRKVLGMIERGDKQHNIAAWFGENQARIVEAEKGSHGQLQPAPFDELPPKGAPGIKGRRMRASVRKAIESLQAGDSEHALIILTEGAKKYDSHEA